MIPLQLSTCSYECRIIPSKPTGVALDKENQIGNRSGDI